MYLSGREISGRVWGHQDQRKLINNSELSKNCPQSLPGVLLGPKYKKMQRKTTGLIRGKTWEKYDELCNFISQFVFQMKRENCCLTLSNILETLQQNNSYFACPSTDDFLLKEKSSKNELSTPEQI